MPDCGVTEFLRGGMIAEAHVTASAITDSRVSGSELSGCQVKELASVDDASAQTIADAIAKLPEGMLVELSKALAKAMPLASSASAPQVTTEDSVPTSIAGNRELLLGKPEVWITHHDFIVPGYRQGQ